MGCQGRLSLPCLGSGAGARRTQVVRRKVDANHGIPRIRHWLLQALQVAAHQDTKDQLHPPDQLNPTAFATIRLTPDSLELPVQHGTRNKERVADSTRCECRWSSTAASAQYQSLLLVSA